MSTKFGLLIDFDLLKVVSPTNTKPEVVFGLRNGYDDICHFAMGLTHCYKTAVFLPRDAYAYARYMPSPGVRLSRL